MMAQHDGPLMNRAGFAEKFAEELQFGNSTASGTDWDSQSESSEDNEQRVQYVPLETPCTPWICSAPRGAFSAGSKELPAADKTSASSAQAFTSMQPPMMQPQPQMQPQQMQQQMQPQQQPPQQPPPPQQQMQPPMTQQQMQPQQQMQQQQVPDQQMQEQMMRQMQQMQMQMQQMQQVKQMQQLQQQWMQAMSSVVTIPVPVPVPVNQLQKPQVQVPFGFQLVPKEKPMLESLLPGQTRGVRRRTTRPKHAESQMGGSQSNKVFVGGLSPHSTAETLRAHFEKFGVITDCAVINEPGTRKSRGFGFVEFAGGIPAGLLEQEHIVGQRRCGVRAYEYTAQAGEVTENAEA